jgi:hypothetical protein
MRAVRKLCVAASLGVLALAVSVPPASAEVNFDLYGGASFYGNPDFTLKVGGAQVDKERGEADTDITFGGRAGYWFDGVGLPWLGVFLDVSYFEPEFTRKGGGSETSLFKAKVRTVPISPLIMLRLPLLQSPEHPNGQLQVYAGAGPGFFWTDTTFRTPLGERVSEDRVDVGVDFRGGLAWEFHPNWAVFTEYRFTYYTVSPERSTNGQKVKLEADLDTHHVLFGISYRFR